MNRRSFLNTVGAAALTFGVSGGIPMMAERGSNRKRPNFVVIFIDDMGYGDIEPFGSKVNNTPHLNHMAQQGMKMNIVLCSFGGMYSFAGCAANRLLSQTCRIGKRIRSCRAVSRR